MVSRDLTLRVEAFNNVFADVETVVNNWWFSDVPNIVTSQQNLHSDNLRRLQEEATKKESELNELTSKLGSLEKDLKEGLISKEAELSSVHNNADQMLLTREKLTETLQQIQAKNKELAEALDVQIKVNSIEQEELQKGSTFFQDRLGLKFNKVTGGWMEVVFTQICKVEPQRPFFFTCRVNENKSYEVGECDPAIKDFQSLTAKLNETNNLRSFIITMRQKFKEYAENRQMPS